MGVNPFKEFLFPWWASIWPTCKRLLKLLLLYSYRSILITNPSTKKLLVLRCFAVLATNFNGTVGTGKAERGYLIDQ